MTDRARRWRRFTASVLFLIGVAASTTTNVLAMDNTAIGVGVGVWTGFAFGAVAFADKFLAPHGQGRVGVRNVVTLAMAVVTFVASYLHAWEVTGMAGETFWLLRGLLAATPDGVLLMASLVVQDLAPNEPRPSGPGLGSDSAGVSSPVAEPVPGIVGLEPKRQLPAGTQRQAGPATRRPSRKPAKKSTKGQGGARDKALAAIEADPDLTNTEVAEQAGVSLGTVKNARRQLRADNKPTDPTKPTTTTTTTAAAAAAGPSSNGFAIAGKDSL